jgi:hypothetical protein
MPETAPLKPSPFQPGQDPLPNGSYLKCKPNPKRLIGWWGEAKILDTLTRAQADLLVQSLREFLEPFIK